MSTAGFETFGTQHLVVLAITIVLPVLLAVAARRAQSQTVRDSIANLVAGLLVVNEVGHWCYRIIQVGLSGFVASHLPLHVCGISLMATAAALLFRNQRAYEIAYFWGLAGSLNAVVTPGEMNAAFPAYRFIQYFTAHSGIVIGTLYATWSLGMRPTLAGLVRAFGYLNVFAVAVEILNSLLDSNYMFLPAPPEGTVSPFFVAPWPWYLIGLDFIGLGLFFVACSPIPMTRWWLARRTASSSVTEQSV